jgi:PleD family two-component response regulator
MINEFKRARGKVQVPILLAIGDAMATEIRRTLLLVDDDPTALKMRAMVLQHEGYHVLRAVSGEEALAIFSSVPVDLVVSDHFLRGDSHSRHPLIGPSNAT